MTLTPAILDRTPLAIEGTDHGAGAHVEIRRDLQAGLHQHIVAAVSLRPFRWGERDAARDYTPIPMLHDQPHLFRLLGVHAHRTQHQDRDKDQGKESLCDFHFTSF